MLIEMAPGRDKQPWYFCRRCYAEGLVPMHAPEAPAAPPPARAGRRKA